MSKFSEKLKLLITESGIKIYQLAKNAELDRTTIQRAMSGERLPGLKFVEKLTDYLRLSPTEKTELLELYSMSKIGEEVYAARNYIKKLIEDVATIHATKENTSKVEKNGTFVRKIDNDTAVFTGQYVANNLIKDVLEDEIAGNSKPEIYISVPFSYNFLFDLLYQLYLRENGKIAIKNIIRLVKNPYTLQNSNYNLQVLSQVIPFAFCAGNGYQPYYYYENFDAYKDIALINPNYIITTNYVVTISSDFKTAILIDNQNIVNTYKDNFKIAIAHSKPLIAEHFSCADLITAYLDPMKNPRIISHVMEPQPCFAWYYTDDLIESHLRQGLPKREMLLELLFNLYGHCKSYTCRPVSIFSVEGLSYFADTGILSDLPTKFAIPFTVEERIMLLTKLRNDMANGDYRVYASNSMKFIIPFCSIQLYGLNGLDFFSVDNNGAISSSYIEEKSIVGSFYDFFESLPDSGLVHSKEETLKIIDDFISKCKGFITK